MSNYQNQNQGNFNGQNQGYGAPQGGYNGQRQGNYGAPQGGYNGQPQGNYGAPQGGYNGQPQGNYGAPQGSYNGQPQGNYGAPQGGYNGQQQGNYGAPQGGNGQQERVNYTPVIYEEPQSGRMEDLMMTMILGINTTQSLFFDKYISKNGNVCVGVSAEVLLGDNFVSKMFGPNTVRPDHTVSISFSFAGYTADNFLKRVPNCTKNLVVVLKNFSVSTFNRRDGSQGVQIHANCIGMQVVHSSSRFKPSEVKNCNLQPSAPFTIRDKTNGAAGNNTAGNAPARNYGAQQNAGTNTPNNYQQNNPGAPTIPGVSSFQEMDDDEELPF